ncbi:MAG TPA: YfdX family protein, partial [Trueperaceae bacterium]|nr:YfdX family protein [Trueperaceae bacterium]
MKKLFVLLTIVLGLGFVLAQDSQAANQTTDQASLQESIDNAQETAETQNPILEDAVAAIKSANDALTALDNNDNDAALEALAIATGKLEVVIAAQPDLALAPVNISVDVYDSGISTVKEASKILRLARVALNDNDAIAARLLLDSLATELRIKTVSLPLASYPDAMLEAASLIKNDKPEEAKAVILNALNTLVITEEYLPLPVIRAQALI